METTAVDWKQAKNNKDRRFLSYQYDEVAGKRNRKEDNWTGKKNCMKCFFTFVDQILCLILPLKFGIKVDPKNIHVSACG